MINAAPAAAGGGAPGADAGDGDELDGGAPAGGAPAAGAPASGQPRTYKSSIDKIRADIAARAAGGGAAAGAAGDGEELGGGADDDVALTETVEEREVRLALLEPDARTAEEDRIAGLEAGALDENLIVDLGARREGEEPLRIEAPDEETANALRALQGRAMQRDTVLRIRDEAEQRFAEADEARYTVELDPAGFLLNQLTDVRDLGHVAQMLLTRPGVLDAQIGDMTVAEWIRSVVENPASVAAEARLVDADRIAREKAVSRKVEARRYEDQNARACRRAGLKSIDSLVPDDWSEQDRDQLFFDVMNDLRAKAQRERLQVVDPRVMAGMVQARLARYGVAPRAAAGTPAKGKGPGGKLPATRQTPETLRQQTDTRRRAAGAGPGAGSPTATMPKPPAGTMLTRTKDKDGKMKPSAFDFLRQHIRSIRRAPQ